METPRAKSERLNGYMHKIAQFAEDEGCTPTIREFAALIGVKSTSYAQRLLIELQGAGLITRSRRARGIEIVSHP